MIFVLEIVRILPAFLFNQSSIDIRTPFGRRNLMLETGASVQIQVPDFITILTFTFRNREVSYSLVDLMCRTKINFAPVPLIVHFNLTREFREGDNRLKVIGHRGSGSNEYRKEHNLPPLPENTVESFENAYKLGTNWVELDVGMTSDDEIVVFHDFAFKGTPVWKMTLEEFQRQAKVQPFRDVLTATNTNITLIVEMKYPSPEDIKEQNLSDDAPEVDHFTDNVLNILKSHATRDVILMSFDPDILVNLRTKSSDIYLFFLTEGVQNKFSDSRRNGLGEAIQFCVENDIQGIVTDSETLSPSPIKFTALTHNAGLSLAVYFWRILFQQGDINALIEDLDCAGVDGVVVDDIKTTLDIINRQKNCDYGGRGCSNGGWAEWVRNSSSSNPEGEYEVLKSNRLKWTHLQRHCPYFGNAVNCHSRSREFVMP